MHVFLSVLTDFNHHQGRICKHVRHLKHKSGLCFNTASLSTICARCNKDTDRRFVLTVSQLVSLLYRLKKPSCPKVMGYFVKTIRSLMNYSTSALELMYFECC